MTRLARSDLTFLSYSLGPRGVLRGQDVDMGVESGGGGRGDASPAVEKSAGDVPPEMMIFQHLFLDTNEKFVFSTIFKIKWPKSEEKLNFWSRWVWVPNYESVPPKQNFLETPLHVEVLLDFGA